MAIQVTGTLLDACVLAMLVEGDAYGYSLTQSIRETLEVSESTLYPVMRRLQTDDCLTTYDQPHSGRNRRYYKITERGMEKYAACVVEWKLFKQRIDSILIGGGEAYGEGGGEAYGEDGGGGHQEGGGSDDGSTVSGGGEAREGEGCDGRTVSGVGGESEKKEIEAMRVKEEGNGNDEE